jgi:hypothetical protein
MIWMVSILIKRSCAYKFIVGDNFDVDASDCGTGLDFRPSESLMRLSETNQIFHGCEDHRVFGFYFRYSSFKRDGSSNALLQFLKAGDVAG